MKDPGLLELLRYALAGGIGIAVLFLAYPNVLVFQCVDLTREVTLIIGTVLLAGALIYHIHRAIVFPVFLRGIGFVLQPKEFTWVNIIPWRPAKSELDSDRWRWSLEEKARKRWDEWGAQTHSLYCAAWAALAALLIGKYSGKAPQDGAPFVFWILFIITVLAGIVNNYRLMFSIATEMNCHHYPPVRGAAPKS